MVVVVLDAGRPPPPWTPRLNSDTPCQSNQPTWLPLWSNMAAPIVVSAEDPWQILEPMHHMISKAMSCETCLLKCVASTLISALVIVQCSFTPCFQNLKAERNEVDTSVGHDHPPWNNFLFLFLQNLAPFHQFFSQNSVGASLGFRFQTGKHAPSIPLIRILDPKPWMGLVCYIVEQVECLASRIVIISGFNPGAEFEDIWDWTKPMFSHQPRFTHAQGVCAPTWAGSLSSLAVCTGHQHHVTDEYKYGLTKPKTTYTCPKYSLVGSTLCPPS